VVKKTHKFGMRVPNSVDEAHAIDKENNSTLWADAIAKERKNVRVAFDIKEGDEKAPVGHQEIRCQDGWLCKEVGNGGRRSHNGSAQNTHSCKCSVEGERANCINYGCPQ
jgi:hypothetical protein